MKFPGRSVKVIRTRHYNYNLENISDTIFYIMLYYKGRIFGIGPRVMIRFGFTYRTSAHSTKEI